MKKMIAFALAAASITGSIALTAAPADARGGCGWDRHRGYYGNCRWDGRGPRPVIGTYYHGWGWWDGHRYWHDRYRYHNGWRYR